MSCCPKCYAFVEADATSCSACQASFPAGSLKPAGELPAKPGGGSFDGVVVKLGLAAVAIPAAGFVFGLLAAFAIPGCQCDTGAGCRGCGANSLIEVLLFGGFVGAIVAFMFILPSSLILAAVVRWLSRRRA